MDYVEEEEEEDDDNDDDDDYDVQAKVFVDILTSASQN